MGAIDALILLGRFDSYVALQGASVNSALEAYFAAVESEHRGTRWAFWTVVVCAGYFLVRIL